MSIFNNVGPDGFLVIEALLVSVFVAALAWRRAGLAAGILVTAVVAMALIVFNATSLNATPGLNYRIVTALFVLVPCALLLGASRLQWVPKHTWVLVLVGPILFVGCYVGICTVCVKTGLI